MKQPPTHKLEQYHSTLKPHFIVQVCLLHLLALSCFYLEHYHITGSATLTMSTTDLTSYAPKLKSSDVQISNTFTEQHQQIQECLQQPPPPQQRPDQQTSTNRGFPHQKLQYIIRHQHQKPQVRLLTSQDSQTPKPTQRPLHATEESRSKPRPLHTEHRLSSNARRPGRHLNSDRDATYKEEQRTDGNRPRYNRRSLTDLTPHAPKAHSPDRLRQRSHRKKRQDIHNHLHEFTPNEKGADQKTPNWRSLQRNERITKTHQDQQLLHNWRDLQECKQGLRVWKTPHPQRPQQPRDHQQNNQPTAQTQQRKVSSPNPLETYKYQHNHQGMQITGFSSKKYTAPKHLHNRLANKSRRTTTQASCKNTKLTTRKWCLI